MLNKSKKSSSLFYPTLWGCNMNQKLTELTLKLQEKKIKQDDVKKKYKDLDKKKKLTQEQRIARIEEILGID